MIVKTCNQLVLSCRARYASSIALPRSCAKTGIFQRIYNTRIKITMKGVYPALRDRMPTPALGNRLNPIPRKERIGRDHRQVIHLGSGNDHAVARVAVDGRQGRRTEADIQIEGEHLEVVVR